MEKKQKIILAIIIVLVVFVFIVLFLSLLKNEKSTPVPVAPNNQQKTDIISKPITSIQNERISILNTARGFIEIYGTYTNTNNFGNIKELYPFMTDDLISKYEKIIANSKPSSVYFSKNTQVLDNNISNYKDGDLNSNVNISVVEKNIDASGKEAIAKKSYVVVMKKIDNKWKVKEVK